MKKFLAAATLSIFCAGMAFAADDITLPAKNGDVKFTHQKHKERYKDCTPCHETKAGGKIKDFNKDAAHKLCKGCHEDKKAGPTKCGECHKK